INKENDTLTLFRLPEKPFVLQIETEIEPAKNKSFSGLYASGSGIFTQCEAEGFRKIAYFFDRPDILTKYTVKIIADKNQYPVLLSNGNLIEEGSLKDNRHFAVWNDPFAKPCYLFALVAGRLAVSQDTFTTMSGRIIDIYFYTEEKDRHKTPFAIASLKRAMKWDETRFGLEYDLDRYMVVAVGDFNMGAMENKGLNIFNTKYVLADGESSTDDDFEAIEGVIGHEYFHNYTGNRVTCRDWFQLSLKEGLTVFRDQEFSADMACRAVRRIKQVQVLRAAQFAEDASPTAHPVRPEQYEKIDNFYTLTVYEKGAEVVRLYHTLFGEQGFRDGLRLYLQRHDGQAATCDDFRRAMWDANYADEDDFQQFDLWYSQAGTPILDISGSLNAENNTYTLTVKQLLPDTPNQTNKQPQFIPLKVALFGRTGKQIPFRIQQDSEFSNALSETVLIVRQKEQQFVLHNITEPVVPSLLRGFSAPVKLNFPYEEQDLNTLMAFDSDEFCRWEAAQTLYRRAILANYDALQNGVVLPEHTNLINNLNQLLTQQLDSAFTALMFRLPETSELLALLDKPDPVVLFNAREKLFKIIALGCLPQLKTIENNLIRKLPENTENALEYNAETAGVRALLNTCRALIAAADESVLQHYLDEYKKEDNFTLSLGLLRAVNHTDCEERKQMLDLYAKKFADNPLAMDKYFSLIATSTISGCLKEVQNAQKHPAFSMQNPNKIYALFMAFARNVPHFHNEQGYAFVANAICTIDAYNPQVAARLTKAFAIKPKLPDTNQALIATELNKILQQPTLSDDTGEIVRQILGA
ncbi:MAG: aminopeptidase N, partial [Neisseriaceae bacterium]|nr:aminopeptidase N [Neisseriaceae bacterium]